MLVGSADTRESTKSTHRRQFLRSVGAVGTIDSFRHERTLPPSLHGREVRTPSTTLGEDVRIAYDPYDDVDWTAVGHHKCEFHNHVRGRMHEPADVVDLYHDRGYTIYAVADHATRPIKWPWTEFSAIDSAYEDRNPETMGVVAFPGSEFVVAEHVVALFTTLTHANVDTDAIDVRWDQSHEIVDRTDHFVPSENGGLAVIAHPASYYYLDPENSWERYRPDFETRGREEGMLGLEVFNRASVLDQDLRLWDRLLTAFAPDRMVWGFGVDDPKEYVLGSDVDVHWTTILMDESEFDPSDQSGSRRAAARAMTAGRTLLHRRHSWDPADDEPASVPHVHAIDVDSSAGTIAIDASNYDAIVWVSRGNVVSTDETVELSTDHAPYVRAHLANEEGSETSTQPFGLDSG